MVTRKNEAKGRERETRRTNLFHLEGGEEQR